MVLWNNILRSVENVNLLSTTSEVYMPIARLSAFMIDATTILMIAGNFLAPVESSCVGVSYCFFAFTIFLNS